MPLLTARDALPHRPRRVLVAGGSGAGKTTLARRIVGVLDLPYVELDGLFHGPGWTPRPSFLAEVQRFSSGPAWVTEWQYESARPLLAARADTLVWLDLPRPVVLAGAVRRTVRRRVRRERLWHGNVEPPLWRVLTDAEHVIRWAWATEPLVAPRVLAALGERPELVVVRLRRRGDVPRWLAGPLAGQV
ncbi:MAG TPA: AAA family ATPase [Frankiaceae bacterium]